MLRFSAFTNFPDHEYFYAYCTNYPIKGADFLTRPSSCKKTTKDYLSRYSVAFF